VGLVRRYRRVNTPRAQQLSCALIVFTCLAALNGFPRIADHAPLVLSAQQDPLQNGLIAHWALDEGSGAILRNSVNSDTGSLAGGTSWIEGPHNAAVQFNGSTGYAALPSIDIPSSRVTLAAWVRITNYPANTDQRIISKSIGSAEQAHHWMLSHVRQGNRNLLRFRLRTGSNTSTLIASSGDLPTNTWFHAAATYDGANMRLFLNGVEVGRAAQSGTIPSDTSVPLNIARSPDGSNYLAGALDDVRIYNRALTAQELTALMEVDSEPSEDTTAPSVPSGVQATALTSRSVRVSWSESTDDTSVTGYRIRRNGSAVTTASGLEWTDTTALPGTTYSYAVSAFDGAGNESAPSSPAQVVTPTDDSAPPQISSVAVTDVTETAATIGWTTNEAATSVVQYGETSAFGSARNSPGTSTSHEVRLTNLKSATTYHYRVVSTDATGNSAQSAGASFTTEEPVVSGASGLLAHWPLNEGSGGTANNAAGGSSATLQGGATWTQGRDGAAVSLDGSTSYLSVPSVPVSGSSLTIATWVKNTSLPAGIDQRIVSKSTGTAEQAHDWMLSLTGTTGGQRLRFRLKTGTTTSTLIASSGVISQNTWYHAAATYDGTRMRLYLDGVEIGSVAKAGAISSTAAAPINIGRSPDGSNYLHGAVDDLRVYSRALSQQEIAGLIEGGGDDGDPDNQPPSVALTSPANGATFANGQSITITATASDPENRLQHVQFFAGSTLLGTDTSAPFSFTWTTPPAGSYALSAVAMDQDGGVATASPVGVTVQGPTAPSPWKVAFTASTDHDQLVTSYVLEVFAQGADPNVATPVATSDLGKPAPDAQREILVDRTAFFEGLAPGNYVLALVARGQGGIGRSAPIQFTR
jgi:hypothetical protein